jgi:hypothetical protein
MNSRLEALLRQRELLGEHVRWLEDEIAQERLRSGNATPAAPAPPQRMVPSPAVSAAIAADPVLMEGGVGEPDVKGLHNEVRRGCLIYFLIAAAALGGLIAFIYWKYS